METSAFKCTSDELENEIIIGLSNILSLVQDYESSTEWTKAVNKTIYCIAKNANRNFLVAGQKLNSPDCSEWLYDIVLYENNKYGLDNVHLVLECEWDNRFFDCDYAQKIQEDFEKLLLAKCKYKVMIYEGKDSDTLKGYFHQLAETVSHCKLTTPSDRYLLCGWNQQAQRFEFEILSGEIESR